ncbi:DUF2312 domain-containing protein [bacterium]|nr:DUF2312 domain-containing protein [bacterium]
MKVADLSQIVVRYEQVEREIAPLKDELKDILKTAKENGIDPKLVRKLVALRRNPKDVARGELETLITMLESVNV